MFAGLETDHSSWKAEIIDTLDWNCPPRLTLGSGWTRPDFAVVFVTAYFAGVCRATRIDSIDCDCCFAWHDVIDVDAQIIARVSEHLTFAPTEVPILPQDEVRFSVVA